MALGLAVLATALALPILFVDVPTSSNGAMSLPEGPAAGAWSLAFIIGTTSFVMAIVAVRRERRRGSPTGKRRAKAALVMAIIGACIWALPVCGTVGSGL